jgi:hypothetical protein
VCVHSNASNAAEKTTIQASRSVAARPRVKQGGWRSDARVRAPALPRMPVSHEEGQSPEDALISLLSADKQIGFTRLIVFLQLVGFIR